MDHGDAMREHIIRDDAAVAAPPHSLGTQDGAGLPCRHLEQIAQTLLERRGLRIVGVVPERPPYPARVDVLVVAVTLRAKATERSEMDVLEARAGQRLRQHADVELRVRSRARDAADIDYARDRRCLQSVDQLCDRTRRVPDRVQRARTYCR